MKRMAMAVCMMVAMSVSTPAFAGECDGVDQYANTIVKRFYEVCKNNCDVAVQSVETVKEMVKFWNEMAGNSWAKIGPRHFTFSVATKGTIQSVGKRTWVSSMPSGEAGATVSIKKTDGKGATRYNICTMDPETKQIVRVGFGDFDKGKDTETQTKKVNGTLGKFVIVELVGESVTKAFAYELTVR